VVLLFRSSCTSSIPPRTLPAIGNRKAVLQRSGDCRFFTPAFDTSNIPSCAQTQGAAPTQACKNTLGPYDCTGETGAWVWNLEAEGFVSDDASKWTVYQTEVGLTRGNWIDPNTGALTAFSNPTSAPIDAPIPQALQQPSGQNKIFWLDSPGTPINLLGPEQPIDSMTSVKNFVSTVCSNVNPSDCVSVTWHTELIVDHLALLDTTTPLQTTALSR
jgi:hypothetical protein